MIMNLGTSWHSILTSTENPHAFRYEIAGVVEAKFRLLISTPFRQAAKDRISDRHFFQHSEHIDPGWVGCAAACCNWKVLLTEDRVKKLVITG